MIPFPSPRIITNYISPQGGVNVHTPVLSVDFRR